MQAHEWSVDVCIVGGGPAGSSLSRRLQRLGHSSLVIERTTFPRRRVGESLTPNIFPLLEVTGVRERVESAGFLRPSSVLVQWAGQTEYRVGAGSGLHVDRGRFDRLLLDAAREAGAIVLQPARAVSIRRSGGAYEVDVRMVDCDATVRAQIVCDASGRTPFTAKSRTRSVTRTVALYAYWRDILPTLCDAHVESADDGWYWTARLPNGERIAAVFVDAETYRHQLKMRGGRTALYNHLLGSSVLLRDKGGRRITEVFACDATPARSAFVACNTVCVGDAAITIDPLSSQGIEVAIGSALHAATVVNTIVRSPHNADLALEFYSRRLSESARLHELASAGFCRAAANFHGTAFWRSRASMVAAQPAVGLNEMQPSESASARLRVSPDAHVIAYSAVVDDQIVPAEAVIGPTLPSPVVFVAGIPIAPLLRKVRTPISADGICTVWAADIPLAIAKRILNWAFRHCIIIES